MRILVALSGGVDSSVIAHMLKEQGHELIGAMARFWMDPLAPYSRHVLPNKCCSVEHIQRARSVCKQLDIPFYVLNLEEEFKRDVVDPFLEDYEKGKTPNPCISCNKKIKFGALLQKAEELGCEVLATGHYARIAEEKLPDGSQRQILLEAEDTEKDQSYYLYGLNQEVLSKILFPLGTFFKSDVFALAQKYKILMGPAYHESQDLCFFPEKEPAEFLKRYLKHIKPGPIKTEDGTQVGSHKGLPFYTIGQRKGLGIGGLKIPLHVTKKEQKSNTVIVAPDGADRKIDLAAKSLNWLSWVPPENEDIPFDARISALGIRHKGILNHNKGIARFRFSEPVRGIAPGQSLVLYKGKELVGGGVITLERS